ncbi:MAG: YeeE/YedE family protein [Flavobacteriales bacterium]|nr:YeeE/YedE family protein [Flavobacteriales bacterium]MCB9447581.1 YeeE/YedE family protein [Flavobacteriales bacterium]
MPLRMLIYGALFGFILTKSEAVSWFRIQEMFHFQSFHMYGIIGSAIVTGLITTQLIKRNRIKTFSGQDIQWPQYQFSKGLMIGGFIFGLGWSMTGACPGPLFILTGNGYTVMAVALLSAIAGTYLYGWLKPKLPH